MAAQRTMAAPRPMGAVVDLATRARIHGAGAVAAPGVEEMPGPALARWPKALEMPLLFSPDALEGNVPRGWSFLFGLQMIAGELGFVSDLVLARVQSAIVSERRRRRQLDGLHGGA